MMGGGMMGSGMMWGMGLYGLIGLVLIVLIIAALIKYLFFRWSIFAETPNIGPWANGQGARPRVAAGALW